MRNRKIQKDVRKAFGKQLALRDYCGVKDPTPYEAVKNIINDFIEAEKKRAEKPKTAEQGGSTE